MSSLIFWTDEKQVLVATDTLATHPDGRPLKFTSKAFIVPHLKIIMSGVGVGGFLARWFVYMNDSLIVHGIDNLNYHAPRALRMLWQQHTNFANRKSTSAFLKRKLPLIFNTSNG